MIYQLEGIFCDSSGISHVGMGLVTVLNFTSITECISMNKEDICIYEKIHREHLSAIGVTVQRNICKIRHMLQANERCSMSHLQRYTCCPLLESKKNWSYIKFILMKNYKTDTKYPRAFEELQDPMKEQGC
ncbi:hypothetical protein E2986_06482 [Frieseomelitta varia]|uniref:Uncharacterized protein n=1 Tax=Frieseomelitta varia TaxID=561572 RepID=A0A833W113_9HYME|nr:hypothetical protein E2986_06482 [Frieseomelitta varia]